MITQKNKRAFISTDHFSSHLSAQRRQKSTSETSLPNRYQATSVTSVQAKSSLVRNMAPLPIGSQLLSGASLPQTRPQSTSATNAIALNQPEVPQLIRDRNGNCVPT